MLFSEETVSALKGLVRFPAPTDYNLPTKFPSLQQAKRICLDLESHDTDLVKKGPGWMRDAYPIGVNIGTDDGFAEYYPIKHNNGPNLDGDKVYAYLRDELAFYKGEIVGANLLYDGDGLQHQSVIAPFAKWKDVQWAEALLDEHAFNYQLERLSRKWIGRGKATDELKAMYGNEYKSRMRDVHPGHLRTYGLGDVLNPLLILLEQEKQLAKEGLTDLWKLECRLMPLLLYMRRIGQRVDVNAAERFSETMNAKLNECLKICSDLVGFELNQENFGKDAVKHRVFKQLGIEYPLTPTGKPSITDDWLLLLKHPIGKPLCGANRYAKAKGTFVDGYVLDSHINGRVYAQFHPLRRFDSEGKKGGTVSGRFSSGNPNLQNIPRRNKEIGQMCRSLFLPDEGADFYSIDYSQIEFRLLVHLGVLLGAKGADVAQSMYKNNPNTDFHNMVVELTGIERDYAKNINFGLAFCMGLLKLAQQMGMVGPDGKPSKKAEEIMAKYHANVPFVKIVSDMMMEQAQKKGFVTTILGRRSRFDNYEPRYSPKGAPRPKALPMAEAIDAYGFDIKRAMCHKALNCYTQGSGADLIKTGLANIWESGVLAPGNDITLSLTVHDESDGSVVPSERGKKSLAEVNNILLGALELTLPIMTSCKTGRNWAETH